MYLYAFGDSRKFIFTYTYAICWSVSRSVSVCLFTMLTCWTGTRFDTPWNIVLNTQITSLVRDCELCHDLIKGRHVNFFVDKWTSQIESYAAIVGQSVCASAVLMLSAMSGAHDFILSSKSHEWLHEIGYLKANRGAEWTRLERKLRNSEWW